jgi:hypothetical protein
MKKRTILLTVAMLFAAIAVCFAADNMFMGTWKFNEGKSKLGAGAAKNNSVTYEAMGDSIKVTVDGVDAKGKTVHDDWTGKFDGKDYPVTGDMTSDMRSYKMVNAHTLELTAKKDGKVIETGTIVVSADGKTRTVTIKGMDSMGMKVSSMAAYDKQ